MIPIPTFVPIALAIALALSLAGNGILTHAYLGKRDEATAAAKDRDQARGDASACSDATEDLRVLADKVIKDGKAAQAAARAAALKGQTKAQVILQTPATVPGDDCKSAQDRLSTWLKGRAKP